MYDSRPLCFVLMPFGVKKDPVTLAEIDFDAVYNHGIRPAIEAAGMAAIRADEERTGGIIHKPMFERLLLCDFAIADLTMSNANVFYELGVRHATRPATTVAIFAEGQRLPFDVNFLRSIPYGLGALDRLKSNLTERLRELRANVSRDPAVDSPLFQLLTEYRAPDIAHLKTDVFRDRVEYSSSLKQRLADLRNQCDEAGTAALETELGALDGQELGVLVDLFLTWRALSRWDRMISLFDRLPWVLKRSVMMREQLGFALNRAGQREKAVTVVEEVLKEQGPSSETLGLMGRIYKDQWLEARKSGQGFAARGYLNRAIDAYVRGFSTDSRDTYPGVNALTLLDAAGDEKSLKQKDELLPVVRFAARQRLKGSPGYWEHATLLEIAVLENNPDEVFTHLSSALATKPERWMRETTAKNLVLIREVRQARAADEPWLGEALGALGAPAT